jgi:hypothetical protein
MIKGDYKVVHYRGYPEIQDGYECYNIREDPDELVDLAAENDPKFLQLRYELQEKLKEKDSGTE